MKKGPEGVVARSLDAKDTEIRKGRYGVEEI